MTATPAFARFDDALLRHHAFRIDHVGINAFFVALSAWQRGLDVTFHYQLVTKCERFSRLAVQGYRGELVSIGDGRKTHYFCRVQGDATSREASARCEDKQATKQRLIEHGIDVPDGVVVRPEAPADVRPFLRRHAGQHFVLKPLNGTLGQGVLRGLTAARVTERLPALAGPHLLEEAVEGEEYRVHVVGGQCVAAFRRVPANVVGDGQHTVAELMARKQALRAAHPAYRHAPLPAPDAARAFMARQGRALEDVPARGETVWLSAVPSLHAGGEGHDATDSLSPGMREIAVRAQQAMGLPNTGLDLIVTPTDRPGARVVVLEANQNPHITPDALPLPGVHPGGGNRIAEALVDHYFPESVDHPRHPRASFDFMQVCQALRSGMVGEVSLPVLGPDWVHRRLTIPATRVDDRTRLLVHRAMFSLGVHAQLVSRDTGDLLIDLVAPHARLHAFMKALKGPVRPR